MVCQDSSGGVVSSPRALPSRFGPPTLLKHAGAQASVRQRAGRAGRVAPGTVLHLYTTAFHERCMPPFADAEILRVPLEQTVRHNASPLMHPGSWN